MTPRERLHNIVELYFKGQMATEAFCNAFERIYNMELNKEDLSQAETLAFDMLFNRVVWYSPFPDERAHIPNYLGEEDIRTSVVETLELLKNKE